MEQEIKVPFLTRIKRAVFNPESYSSFMLEKTKTAIMYLLKILLIFALIVSIAFTYKICNNKEELFNNNYLNYFGEEYATQVKEWYNNVDDTYLIFLIYIISVGTIYIAVLLTTLLDVLIFGVFGFITSRLCRIRLKYSHCFNISSYAVTLSLILLLIYECLELFLGITIKYFSIAYDAITYVYIVTAIMMIRADPIKQKIEVGKIIKEQEKVKEEIDQEEQEKQKQEEDKKDKEENKENKDEDLEGETPEGGEA